MKIFVYALKKSIYLILALFMIVVGLGFTYPKSFDMPVQGIHKSDLIHESNEQIIEIPTIRETQIVEYGGLTYIGRDDGLYERNGFIWKPIKVITTAYTWMDDGIDPAIGAGDGVTSINKDAKRTYGIAADPKALPYGTEVHVEGYGVYSVDDTGGAMRNNYRKHGIIQLDLRIPQLKYDGTWRSVSTIRKIAKNHGRKSQIVLVKIGELQ